MGRGGGITVGSSGQDRSHQGGETLEEGLGLVGWIE